MIKSDARIRERGLALMRLWRDDWVRFVVDVFGYTLDDEQAKILRSVQHNRRTSAMSGTARGKDFVAACAALAFLYLTPRWDRNGAMVANTKVALTAPTDRQVRNILMPEISKLVAQASRRGVVLPGKLTTEDIRFEGYKEWFLTGFKADPHHQEAWAGFHAVNTMFVVTEATGISDEIFAAIDGNMQGNSRELLVFNPNTSVGYAARTQRSERWVKHRLSDLDAPNVRAKRIIIPGQVDYEWVADKVHTWAQPIDRRDVRVEQDDFEFEGVWFRPDDLFRIKVLGCFPKVGEDVLIPAQWLRLAHERWTAAGGRDIRNREEGIVLGVDVAGMGRDSTCFCERHGGWVAPLGIHNSGGQADHMLVAGEIVARRKARPSMYVSIDAIGEGAGVYARLVEVDDKRYIAACKFSESTRQGGRELRDRTGQRTFVNMRAYCLWAVRDWLNPAGDEKAMLPPDDLLDEEAMEVRWLYRSDGRIQIEPKEDIRKRIGRSTDRLDALANTFYPIQRRRQIDAARINRLIR